jgi:photosystem II stability/assembly factor-like uncharacterized protein
MADVMVLVGTRKGLFILESDEARRDWEVRGPYCEGWPIFHAIYDRDTDTIFAAAASEWHGTAIWRSADKGETWEHSSEGLSYPEGGPKLTKASSLQKVDGTLYAGVHQPGIFKSDDGAQTWSYFSGVEYEPARKAFMEPEASPPGDLGIIGLWNHPSDPQRMIANVQGFGLFQTPDGGTTWEPRNNGFRADWPQDDPSWGYCIHKVVTSPVDPDRLYTQTHVGMYRSADWGGTWEEITKGLPSEFGFPAVAHPHELDTLFLIPVDPLHARSTPGRLVVYRSKDAGDTWEELTNGLPQEDAYLGVLREGASADTLPEPGIYFGTSTGQVFASPDAGESWSEVSSHLPGIASVEAYAL